MRRKRLSTAHKLFRELKSEIIKALFVKEFLNAALLFFILNIPLTLLSMSFFYSLVPSLLFLVFRLYRGYKDNVITKIEKGNPEVHEILHTAYEHQDTDSLMVQGMMYDLQKKLATVSTGVLVDPRRAIGKIVLIAILVLVPLAVVSIAPSLIQANPLQGVDFSGLAGQGEAYLLQQIGSTNLSEEEITYGDINLALLGEDELNLQFQSESGGIDASEESELQERNFRQGSIEGDIGVEQERYDSGARVYDESEVALINAYGCKQRGDC